MQEDNMCSKYSAYEEYCYYSDQFVWKDAKANGIKEFWMTLSKEEVVFVIDTLELIWNRYMEILQVNCHLGIEFKVHGRKCI